MNESKVRLLGDYKISLFSFPELKATLKSFQGKDFKELSEFQKFETIGKSLLELIQKTPSPCFLLPAVLEYIREVVHLKVLTKTYSFSLFEVWLNLFSGLKTDENRLVRGKIVGKMIPRGGYQSSFPVGMGKIYSGPHFVAAHLSPDLDTTIASFWGWLDAFGAQVSDSNHVWHLPTSSDVESPAVLSQTIGLKTVGELTRSSQKVAVTAVDLLDQKQSIQVVKQPLSDRDLADQEAVFVGLDATVEEMKEKVEDRSSLKVVFSPENPFLLGVIQRSNLNKEVLGTLSFRDFSNFSEINAPSYLQLISVVDHHKLDLKTTSQAQIFVNDVQSCNTLVAELAFQINDEFGLGGLSQEGINKQLASLKGDNDTQYIDFLFQRLLKRRSVSDQQDVFWISKEREWAEYMSFIHAIIDDTDLFSKVTDRDVIVIASLLNRLKSIDLGKETVAISLFDLPRDSSFAKKSAERILNHPDMQSIYKKIYASKSQEIEKEILLASKGDRSHFFSDTKKQNSSSKVGQTKLFSGNFPFYEKFHLEIKRHWEFQLLEQSKKDPTVDLFIHMVSTVRGANDDFNSTPLPSHQDELWLWIPGTPKSQIHLSKFLSGFQNSKEAEGNRFEVELFGDRDSVYESLFKSNFLVCPIKQIQGSPFSLAVIKCNPGSINSRKGAITPYLPL